MFFMLPHSSHFPTSEILRQIHNLTKLKQINLKQIKLIHSDGNY